MTPANSPPIASLTATRPRPAQREGVAGYTLTEIMVAVAIVGILAAIGIVQYQSYALRAQVAGALEFASESRTRVSVELAQNRTVQTDLLNNGGKPVNDITALTWHPAESGASTTGHILVTMKLPGQGIKNVFALELKPGGLWQCVNAGRYVDPATALSDEHLPAACREGANPIAPPSPNPADTKGKSDSECIESDPVGFKSKKAGQDQTSTDKPKYCPPQTPKGDTSGGDSGNNSSSSGNSGSNSSGSSTSAGDTGSGATQSGNNSKDGKGSNANAGVASETTNIGGATTADTRGNGGDVSSKSESSGFSTKGSTTTLCGTSFEVVNNACVLAGSSSPRVCRSSKENCERANVPGRDCPATQPFAGNVIENMADGTRHVVRRCVSRVEALQGVKKNRETPACTSFDADKTAYARFSCLFPCYGIDCNYNLVPDVSTRLTWDNDIVDAASGRKRAKTEADLPDLFDQWSCPSGTMPDSRRTGHCIRDGSAAAAKPVKTPEGKTAGK